MKRKGMFIIGAAALACCAVGVANISAKADAAEEKTIAGLSYGMHSGAAVRVPDGDGVYGLKYSTVLSVAEYEWLIENKGDGKLYESVQFGILLAPNEGYHTIHPLNEENCFGKSAVYAWAEWDSSSREWVYDESANAGKVRIMNFVGEEMVQDKTDEGYMSFSAVLTDIKDGTGEDDINNLTKEFIGVGYLKYSVAGGEAQYIFTEENDNVRSMTYVAQMAIADTSENAISAGAKAKIEEMYVAKVKDTATQYTVETYKGNTLSESENCTSTIDAEITLPNREIDGYEHVQDVMASERALANDKLVIKRYYKKQIGLIDKKSVSEINLNECLPGKNYTFYKVYGNKKIATSLALINGKLPVSEMNGLYSIESEVASTEIDVYNSEEKMVWNDLHDENSFVIDNSMVISEIVADSSVGAAFKVTATATATETADYSPFNDYSVTILPIHSKAYYELFEKYNPVVKIDVYTKATSDPEGTSLTGFFGGYNFSNSPNGWTQIGAGRKIYSIQLSALLENFDLWGKAKTMFFESRWFATGGKEVKIAYTAETYFGNVYLETENSVEDELVLIDTKNSSVFNVSNNATEKGKAILAKVNNASYTLTNKLTGENVAVQDGVIELSALKKGIYLLAVSEYGIPLYTRQLDIYNSDDGMVWSDMSKETIYAENMSVAADFDDLPNGKSGKYMKLIREEADTVRFTISPLHSKQYYEMYKDSVEYVCFDVYLKITASSGSTSYVMASTSENLFYLYSIDSVWNHRWLQFNINRWSQARFSLNDAIAHFENFSKDMQAWFGANGGVSDYTIESMEVFLGNITVTTK